MSEKATGFWSAWFEHKEFSSDWSSDRFSTLASVLAELVERNVNVLEIGSWEGRSALFFLEFLPSSKITCIDSFEGSPLLRSIPKWSEAIPHIEGRFERNLAAYGERVEKICAFSVPGLFALSQANRTYDLIYIDGSHHCDDVLLDSILSWRLLSEGGVLVWDDYLFQSASPPKPAIDAFLALHLGEFAELHCGKQLIVRKVIAATP